MVLDVGIIDDDNAQRFVKEYNNKPRFASAVLRRSYYCGAGPLVTSPIVDRCMRKASSGLPTLIHSHSCLKPRQVGRLGSRAAAYIKIV